MTETPKAKPTDKRPKPRLSARQYDLLGKALADGAMRRADKELS